MISRWRLVCLVLFAFLLSLAAVAARRWRREERKAVESFLGISPKEIEAIEKMLQKLETDRDTPRLLQDFEEYFEQKGIVPSGAR